MKIQPVVLCGGSGSRLWPLSREQYPKQLLQLAGPNSLLQDTVLRLSGLPGGMAPPPMAAAAGPSAEDITQVIRWQAVMRADKPSGVRVYPGANAQLFSQLGLRPGDLVLAINDSPLADQANGEQFIRSLAGTPQARLTIERAGRTESLLVDLATLSNPLNANPINSVR